MLAAVLTGDIVASQQLSKREREQYLKVLQQLLMEFRQRYRAEGEIYRGDGFQIYTEQIESAVEMAVDIRLALRNISDRKEPIDARISVAIGESEGLGESVATTSAGEVFLLSGAGLEKMKNERLTFVSSSKLLQDGGAVIISFIDHLINSLKFNGSNALRLKLRDWGATHEVLAKSMGVGRTSYTRFLNRAEPQRIADGVDWFRCNAAKAIYWQ